MKNLAELQNIAELHSSNLAQNLAQLLSSNKTFIPKKGVFKYD